MLRNVLSSIILSIFFMFLVNMTFAQNTPKVRNFKKNNSTYFSDSITTLNGPRTCYSAETEKMLRAKYPELGTREEFEKSIQRIITARKAQRVLSPNAIDTIPVIVHIIHNGDEVGINENISAAQVYSQFTVLNNDYGHVAGTLGDNSLSFSSDSKIRFAPAQVDPNGNNLAEMGIHRVKYSNYSTWNNYSTVETILKPQTQWDPNQYLNIWVVKFGSTGDLANLLGYAQFPIGSNTSLNDLATSAGSNTDGVLINYLAFGTTGNISSIYNKGRTTTHELGHYFGLYHTWGDESDCSGTDYCEDTPLCSGPKYTCNDTVQCGFNRLISNYMDYSYDYCMNNFTNDQIDRMTAVLASSSRRITLPTSDVRKFAAFTQNIKLIGEGDSVSFTAQSNFNPTQSTFGIYNTSVPYPISTLAGTAITYTFPKSGVYDIGLMATYPTVVRKKLKSQYVGVISKSKALLPITENFEGSSYLSNWIAFNKDTISNWKITPTNISIDSDSKPVIGANNVATKALYCNNYDIDYEGSTDALISPLINLSGVSTPSLNFNVAYSTIFDAKTGILYTDTLQILITTNSGASFIKIWQKGGTNLATTPYNNKGFVPSSATYWRAESISLSPYVGIGDFNLAITNLSGYANNLFIDNISISGIATATPTSNFYSPTKIVCKNRPVQLMDSSLNIPSAWNWSLEGGTPNTSTVQNPFLIYTDTGRYNVQLIASNSFGSGSTALKTKYIQVILPPTLTQSTGTSPILTSNLATGNQWYYNDFAIPNATTPSFTPTNAGTYYVVNTLGGNSCKSNFGIITGLEPQNMVQLSALDVNIFPNPATNELFLSSNGIWSGIDMEVSLFSLLGNEGLTYSTYNNEDGSIRLDIGSLPAGAYFAKISIGSQTVFRRWVKL